MTEPQNCWGWKGPQETSGAAPWQAGCPAAHGPVLWPGTAGLSPGKEPLQPLWATCSVLRNPHSKEVFPHAVKRLTQPNAITHLTRWHQSLFRLHRCYFRGMKEGIPGLAGEVVADGHNVYFPPRGNSLANKCQLFRTLWDTSKKWENSSAACTSEQLILAGRPQLLRC